MRKLFVLLLIECFLLIGTVRCAELKAPFEKLDLRFLSQLRVDLRKVENPIRCKLFWRGISGKLSDSDVTETGIARGEKLSELVRSIRNFSAYERLADFIEGCSKVFTSLGQEKDEDMIYDKRLKKTIYDIKAGNFKNNKYCQGENVEELKRELMELKSLLVKEREEKDLAIKKLKAFEDAKEKLIVKYGMRERN